MILEIFLALFLGIFIGTLTGLFPGIHFNLISVILISNSSFFIIYVTHFTLAVFIVAMAITHTILDTLPGIFLGAPKDDSILSILPGHKLLINGHGYAAAMYTIYGTITALFLLIIFTPIFIIVLPIIYPFLQKFMSFILIAIILVMLIFEKKKMLATIIFFLAGILGIATLNLPLREPLLPLLTGLFGTSSLLASIQNKTKVAEQKIPLLSEIKLSKKSIIKTIGAACIASPITAFLPGLGASQSAVIGKTIMHSNDEREFLYLIGIINTFVMALSISTLFAIQKTRTGAAVAISQLLPKISFIDLFLLTIIMIMSGVIAAGIACKCAKFCAQKINSINYTKISYSILLLTSMLVFIFSDLTLRGGLIAMLICITATALGLFTYFKNITRIHLMGCLLLPTILYYI